MSDLPASKIVSSVLVLELNPVEKRNPLSIDALNALAGLLRRHADDQRIKSVIIKGAGDCFSGGADLKNLSGTAEDMDLDDAVDRVVEEIGTFPGPVVASVEGCCMGAAVDLALSCDLCVAGDASYFEVPATRMGLLYNPESLVRKSLAVSRQTLTRLFVIGERLDATAALSAGLISIVVEAGGAFAKARELASRAEQNSRQAMAATKGLLRVAAAGQFDAGHWQTIRMEFLTSDKRQAAVRKIKRQLGLIGDQ